MACDHYHRWAEDLDLARRPWTERLPLLDRLAADPAQRIDQHRAGLDFYSRLVDGMLARGLEPWPTLYHWDLPQRLQDLGGWTNRDTVEEFVVFADASAAASAIACATGSLTTSPGAPHSSAVTKGRTRRACAAGARHFKPAITCCSRMDAQCRLCAQTCAMRASASLSVCIRTRAQATVRPIVAAMRRYDGLRNRWFLDPLYGRGYPADIWALCGSDAPRVESADLATIATPTDFLGVNYYFPETIARCSRRRPARGASRAHSRRGAHRSRLGGFTARPARVARTTASGIPAAGNLHHGKRREL